MLISPFLPSTGGQASDKGNLVQQAAEGQDFLRRAILYDCNNKSNEKQVKEAWSQNWLLLCNNFWQQA